MNKMNKSPKNMTRVLIKMRHSGIFEFAFFKDGLYKIQNNWYDPGMYEGWLSLSELKKMIDGFPELLKIVIEYNKDLNGLATQNRLSKSGIEWHKFIKETIKKETE